MMTWVTDKKFIVGIIAGAFAVPYVLKTVSLRMAARTTKV